MEYWIGHLSNQKLIFSRRGIVDMWKKKKMIFKDECLKESCQMQLKYDAINECIF